MSHFFQLIRYKNLLLLAFMQFSFYYGFLKLHQNITLALNHWQYVLLVLATIFIAAGGNIINDIQDQQTDSVNKPNKLIVGLKITEELAFNIYFAVTIIGVALGHWLSYIILRPSFVIVFIFSASLLYFYSTTFKQVMFVGNLIVSFLLALSVILVGVFTILPALSPENLPEMKMVFSVLIDFAFMAFIVNFLREIVKDIEDYEGDFNNGIQTFPVKFGVQKATKLVMILNVFPIAILLFYVYSYLFHLTWATLFIFTAIIGPLLFISLKLFSAKTKPNFTLISFIYKIVIITGILSAIVIALNRMYYVAKPI